jgi:hypothetical protein
MSPRKRNNHPLSGLFSVFSVNYYKKGMELSLECQKRLEEAKQVIVKKVDQGKETDF